jgi:hypothetical protein
MKIVGYLVSLLGLAGIAATVVPSVRVALKIPSTFSTTMLTAASGVLILIGIVLLLKSGGSNPRGRELPIYRGKHIVGYRREK